MGHPRRTIQGRFGSLSKRVSNFWCAAGFVGKTPWLAYKTRVIKSNVFRLFPICIWRTRRKPLQSIAYPRLSRGFR